MKKIISIALAIMTLFSALCFSACSDDKPKLKRALIIPTAGSAAYVASIANAPYKIEELGITSTENYFYFEDYVCDKQGDNYTITNAKGNKVGIIALSKKEQIYSENRYRINLDTYEHQSIIISEEMNYVEIYSSNPNVEKELHIFVNQRTKPLDLTLNNVNAYTKNTIPVLFCTSDVGINIICKGKNRLKAGKELISNEEYQYYLDNEQNFKDALTESLMPWQIYYAAVNKTIYNFTNSPSADIFVDNFENSLKEMLELTQNYWWSVMDALSGTDGYDGYDGVATIQVFNLSLFGDGQIDIIGGNGSDGYDGSTSILSGSKGGDGGDSGSAIYCKTYINLMDEENYNIQPGTPGSGGKGSIGIGQSTAHVGRTGKSPKSVKTTYEFVK